MSESERRGGGGPIPCTYRQAPPGFTRGSATYAELKAAGFYPDDDEGRPRPGDAPLDELAVEGPQRMEPGVADQLLRASTFVVLRDPDGVIAATWDEGRWWTPSEANEHVRRLVAEMKGDG